MNFQSEHIEKNNYEKQKMTTVLAIKCNEGIVLACDSQGTVGKMKINVKKLFRINNSIGLVGAGTEDQTSDLVNHLQMYLGNTEFSSEFELKNRIQEAISNLNSIKNVVESIRLGYQNTSLLFYPSSLIGAKLANNTFCLYEVGFGSDEKTGIILGGVIPWNKYKVLGSGLSYATIIIKQHDRIHTLDKLDINVGISIHAIAEAKDIDLLTGKNTHIAIIDKTGYKEVKEDQSKYYDKMIDSTCSILCEQVDKEKFKELLKNIFPSDYIYY